MNKLIPASPKMNHPDISARQEVLAQATFKAGQMAHAFRQTNLDIDVKGPQDFVTNADIQVEAMLVDLLKTAFPDDQVFAEENSKDTKGDGIWVIDPIDGTTNYACGSDYWAVSVAWMWRGRVELGAIYAADRNELLVARRRRGAFLNGRKLTSLEHSNLVTPLYHGYSNRTSHADYLKLLARLKNAGLSDRKLGSAALGLAHVARGDACAFYEKHLNSWDCMAGLLICAETGCDTSLDLVDLQAGGLGFAGQPRFADLLAGVV